MTRVLPRSRSGAGLLLAVGGALLALALFAALLFGAVDVEARAVISALFGGESDPPMHARIVRGLRLPRALGAALVGGALAVVGATLQSVMKNPLADPYVLGISSGAAVGASLAALFGAGYAAPVAPPLLAFVFALGSVVLVYRVALVGGRAPPMRLLLAGVALSSFAQAITGLFLYLVPEASAVRGVIFWLMGGLGGADWPSLLSAALVAVPASIALLLTGRWQTLLLFGDEAALSLGLEVRSVRRRLIALCALATGALVAFAGAIGFVGLIVPHALRPFAGSDHRVLLPLAATYGALLLVVVDTAARTAIAPHEIPVGILTGLLGAPFFLLLLRRAGDAESG